MSQQTRCPVSRFFEKSMESTLPTSCLYQQYAQYCRVNIDILYTMNIKTPICIHMWFTYTSIYNIHTNTYIFIYIYIFESLEYLHHILHVRLPSDLPQICPGTSAESSIGSDRRAKVGFPRPWLCEVTLNDVKSVMVIMIYTYNYIYIY